MKIKLLPAFCVLLVASVCIIVSRTSETVIAAPTEARSTFLSAERLSLELSNGKREFVTDPKLVEVGSEVFIAGNDTQHPKKTRYFSLRHIVEAVGYPAIPGQAE